MSMKHTPGPWHTVSVYADTEVQTQDGALVAVVTPVRCESAENARLIAAAPELLAALLLITQADPCIAKTTDDELRAAMEDEGEEQEVREQARAFLAARAAVAKATGGQA